MSRAAADPSIARRQAGRVGAVAAVLMTLSVVLLGEGAPGDLDPAFGVGGKVTTDFGGTFNEAQALILQPDGKLVAAGVSCGEGNLACDFTLADFVLARYQHDGRLDSTFGAGGKVTTDFGSDDVALALVLPPDGKLVAAGVSGVCCGERDLALARYLPDGRLDPTFGVGGKVTTDFGGSDLAHALVLQPDGKLVAAGGSEVGDFAFALARYLPDGRLDSAFGAGGKVTTDFGLEDRDVAFALVLQSDGKLVAAGSVQTGEITDEFGNTHLVSDFALARYLNTSAAIAVTIDIKPGSSPNSINPKSNGVIPVAILTTDTFDATTVDPLSVRFGPKGATEAHSTGHIEDVNQDGEPDLMLHFRTQETGIQCGATSASLTGETFTENPIQGSDSIKTVACNK